MNEETVPTKCYLCNNFDFMFTITPLGEEKAEWWCHKFEKDIRNIENVEVCVNE